MEQTTNQGANTLGRKFPAGIILTTPGVLETFEMSDVTSALERHFRCDWGDMSVTDKKANDQALEVGARLFSGYKVKGKEKLWIITEGDRSATTIMLPSEY